MRPLDHTNLPPLKVALAGNPNAGKSTLFNALTGLRQHVGNYPGVTVEKKEGTAEHHGRLLHVVDLPGTYSLTAYSVEEIVARNFLLDERPDVVVHVVDSTNLERNLYLATQLLTLGVPLVLAFNMADVAAQRGQHINVVRLSQLFGAPIVRTVGSRGHGIEKLLDAIVTVGGDPAAAVRKQRQANFGHEIEPHVQQLTDRVSAACGDDRHARWFAVKLLEDDEDIARRLRTGCGDAVEAVLGEAARIREHLQAACGDSPEIVLADRRYGFVSGACTEAVRQTVEARHERSDAIDLVLTHRIFGLPLFAGILYLVFQFTFWLGNPMVDLLDGAKSWLADAVRAAGPSEGFWALGTSLLADGVIEGVGSVLCFVPLIALLYLAIAVLEDTGYMARAAFVLDRLMHHVGLHGKSFIPMVLGFGCTVPAILATRILEDRRDRLTTMLVLPLMSCGARLPVYVLIIGAFFQPTAVVKLFGLIPVTNQALLLLAMYAIGGVLGLVAARVLRKTLFAGEAAAFVMELPPYRMPTVKGLAIHTGERTWHYVKKAGTVILLIAVVLWALKTFPMLPESRRQEVFSTASAAAAAARSDPNASAEARRLDPNAAVSLAQVEYSAVGRIGGGLAHVLSPCGFDWKISTALLGSFAAKEAFVSQMGIVYAVDHPGAEDDQTETLRQKLADDYTPLQGFCMMLFVLICTPCAATLAVTAREAGHWKWAAFQWTYLTALAWLLTAAVYQIGTLLGS